MKWIMLRASDNAPILGTNGTIIGLGMAHLASAGYTLATYDGLTPG